MPSFVDLVSTAPSELFGLYPRKGTIAIGSDADFVLWDPKKKVTFTNEPMHHRCDYTPWEGYEMTGYPVILIYEARQFFGTERCSARLVEFISPGQSTDDSAVTSFPDSIQFNHWPRRILEWIAEMHPAGACDSGYGTIRIANFPARAGIS